MQAVVWIGVVLTVALALWLCVEMAREASRDTVTTRASRLHVALMVALGITCLALLVVGARAHQRWSVFLFLVLPFLGLSVWLDLRLLRRRVSGGGAAGTNARAGPRAPARGPGASGPERR